MNKRIFISYKRSDKKRAFAIKDDIESAVGEKCWIDMEGIESHAQFVNVIIKAIDDADIFLFLYSKRHTNIVDYENDWSVREINYAQSEGKRIIFLNIDGAPLSKWFKLMFGLKQQVDVNSEEAMDKLYVDLRKYLGKDDSVVVKRRKKINFFLKNSILLPLLLISFISCIAIYYSTKQKSTLDPENLTNLDTITPEQRDTILPPMPTPTPFSPIATSITTPENIKSHKQDSDPKVQGSKKKSKVSKTEVKKDTIILDENGFKALVEKLSLDKRLELAKVLNGYINSHQFEKAAETVSDWINKGEIDSTKFYFREVFKEETLKEQIEFSIGEFKFQMILVKGGVFKCDEGIEVSNLDVNSQTVKSVKKTYVLDDFYIAETEVTQGLWKIIMKEDISQKRDRLNPTWQLRGKGDDMPMYYISYRDCLVFIKRLNEIFKKELGNKKFGFPTDVQWMFAGQGGLKTHH